MPYKVRCSNCGRTFAADSIVPPTSLPDDVRDMVVPVGYRLLPFVTRVASTGRLIAYGHCCWSALKVTGTDLALRPVS